MAEPLETGGSGPSRSGSPRHSSYDAVVVGSGPNGLSAAIRLVREGASVLLVEAHAQPGGGMRTAELTLPGFHHDVCAAVHPMAQASPWFRELDLGRHGVEWIHADYPVVHPLTPERTVVQERSVEATANRLGSDATAWRHTFEPLVRGADQLYADLLGPFKIPRHLPSALRFGKDALFSARFLASHRFSTPEARALFAGHAAHSVLPLDFAGTAAFGLMLALSGHAMGWPIAKGGSQRIVEALLGMFESAGGELVCGWHVRTIEELPKAKAYLFDTAPQSLARICESRLPEGYRARLNRYRHGPAAFKLDWALSEPVPWRDPECRKAVNLHVGGDFEEVAQSEKQAWQGHHGARPFLIFSQPSLFDETRAPAGRHTAWAYGHVPNGSTLDVRDRIEAQVERFAPGFRDTILDAHAMNPAQFEAYNPNYVGGDIIGGVQDLRQLYTRPVIRRNPYTTPRAEIFICSASTPPGAGVHGMCGFHAAGAALRRLSAR